MSPRTRPDHRTLYVEVPERLAQRLEELARQTGRPMADEVGRALEFWVERQGMGDVSVEAPVPATPAVPPAGELERQLEASGPSAEGRA